MLGWTNDVLDLVWNDTHNRRIWFKNDDRAILYPQNYESNMAKGGKIIKLKFGESGHQILVSLPRYHKYRESFTSVGYNWTGAALL